MSDEEYAFVDELADALEAVASVFTDPDGNLREDSPNYARRAFHLVARAKERGFLKPSTESYAGREQWFAQRSYR